MKRTTQLIEVNDLIKLVDSESGVGPANFPGVQPEWIGNPLQDAEDAQAWELNDEMALLARVAVANPALVTWCAQEAALRGITRQELLQELMFDGMERALEKNPPDWLNLTDLCECALNPKHICNYDCDQYTGMGPS